MFLSLPLGICKAGSRKMGNAKRKSLSQWQWCWFCRPGANSWPDSYPQDAASANSKWPKDGYQRNAPTRGKFSLGHVILLWVNVQVLPDPTGTLISKSSAAKIQNTKYVLRLPWNSYANHPYWALETVEKGMEKGQRDTKLLYQNCSCILGARQP